MSEGTVLVLCGLPASGKTWLAGQLEMVLGTKNEGTSEDFYENRTCVFRVTYDLLLPSMLEKKLVQQQQMAGSHYAWRDCREGVVRCADCLMGMLLNPQERQPSAGTFASELSDMADKDKHQPGADVQEVVQEVPPSLFPQFLEMVRYKEQCGGERCKPRRWVIVVDDNMYYHSMRYQYFQLARKYSVGFCQVHVTCSTEAALQHNAGRGEGRVPDEVIVTMATKMEEPQPLMNPWEKSSISWTWSEGSSVGPVLALLEEAWGSPVLPVEENKEERELSRRACSASLLHQVDQILRKLTACEMASAKDMKSRSDLRSHAKTLSAIKSDILEEFHQGSVVLDWMELEVADASRDSESPLYRHVAAMFHCKLGGLT